MTFLFIGSTGGQAGHTILTWALVERLIEKGFKVGFLKPFGTHPILQDGDWIDQDALLFKSVLELKESFSEICPYPLANKTPGQQSLEDIPRRIKTLAVELSAGKDILIVMGSKHIFFDDASLGISDIFLNRELKAEFILIERFRSIPKSMYSILSIQSLLPERIKGIILNRASPEEIETIRRQLMLPLSKRGVGITAVLPEDPMLSRRSIGEIAQILEGNFLCGEDRGDESIDGTTLGSLQLKGDLQIFKRVFNKIILLRSEVVDVGDQEPRSRNVVAGMLITGGRIPPLQIVETAKMVKLPLLLVKDDTFKVMERLEETPAFFSPKDKGKVRYFMRLMDQDDALEKLILSLDLTIR